MPFEQTVDNSIKLQFRLATNGVIVNTISNNKSIITTSAGTFNR